MIKFGPAGMDDSFGLAGYKKSEEVPIYLRKLGLSAYEYQCSRGVKISKEKAEILGKIAKKNDIDLSVHSPYYISLSNPDEDKKTATIKYITDTMVAAKNMGATRIVVHAGSLLGLDRKEAVQNACDLLKRAKLEADSLGLGEVHICPETMGKINQLGDSKEIIQMCLVDDSFIPTIDFGHLYCRSLGAISTKEDWINELKMYVDDLGIDRMKHFHSHFSKMEYTEGGGEKRHVTLEDEMFGPDFKVICEALKELDLEPIVICESAGTQSTDSVKMKGIYEKF